MGHAIPDNSLKDGVLEISRDEPWMSDAPFRHWQNIASLVEGVETDASYLATAIIFVDLGKVMKKIVGPISAMQFLLDKNGSYMTEETNWFATLVEEAMQNQYNASVDGSVDGNQYTIWTEVFLKLEWSVTRWLHL